MSVQSFSWIVLLILFMDVVIPVEGNSKNHENRTSRRPLAIPQASDISESPRRTPAIISESLHTVSYKDSNYYYFTFKLDGRSVSYRLDSSKVSNGVYLLAHAGSSQLMVTVDGESPNPVYLERNLIDEALQPLPDSAIEKLSN